MTEKASGTFTVRKASEADMPALREISSLTWEGDDYLSEAAAGWISQGGFYVGTLDGLVVGTVKVSLLPGRVVWLEGLRVHPNHKGRGWGRALAEHSVREALNLVRSGRADLVEFVTYVKNLASIEISRKLGFRLQEGFVILSRPTAGCRESGCRTMEELREVDLSCFPVHVPAGWVMVPRCPESMPWLRSAMTVHRFGGASFMLRRGQPYFVPLRSSVQDPVDFIRGANVCAVEKGMERHDIVLHESMRELLQNARDAGFEMWDEVDGPNMLLFRLAQSGSVAQ